MSQWQGLQPEQCQVGCWDGHGLGAVTQWASLLTVSPVLSGLSQQSVCVRARMPLWAVLCGHASVRRALA